ncbi:MAG: hypothetical protein ABI861_04760 [Panacibacter sp.]
MFTQTWKKYLPVIIILLKRSAQGDQILSMNHTDFERAAGGRKMKYSFNNLQLKKAKINTEEKHSPVARELATVLQEDSITSKLIISQHLEFTLNNDFKLTIRNTTPPPEPVEETVVEEDAAI